MAKVNELQPRLDAIETSIDEAGTEISKEIQTLRDSLANTDLPEGATASLDRLTTKAKALADIVPNPEQPPA